ncbi:MAG: hypothetical protein K9N01_04505, partial [Cephaloticoccus sp.]|nr:hypothetical protein [Cephaloticoccus sp.]
SSPRPWWASASGIAFGLSVLAKQPGVLDYGVALVLLILRWLIVPEDRRKIFRLLGLLLAGLALPLA